MGVFEDALKERAPNSPEESYLAPGWAWSIREPKKVKKGGGTYMKANNGTIHYQRGRNYESGRPGDLHMDIPRYPYMYLIMLTYLEDEIQRVIKEKR